MRGRSNWPTSICCQRPWLVSKSGSGPEAEGAPVVSRDSRRQGGAGGGPSWPWTVGVEAWSASARASS
ncbi:MAG: hypothetical protein LBP95_04505 [Deltaproteobacteria bacterium]|nr:hypothetical protein [Deltaproteobacteria bacterium]